LTLIIERSDDSHRDRQLIRRLHGFLTQYPGHDTFCFIMEGGGKRRARLDFPNHPIAINDEILEFAAQKLGVESVVVEG